MITSRAAEARPSDILSFRNYKIDYSHPLGEGKTACVYPLIERPEKEKKTCLSKYLTWSWFPYIHDYLFRFNAPLGRPSQYCIKVFKMSIFDSFFLDEGMEVEYIKRLPLAEKESNEILHKYALTKIHFFNGPDNYSQIKTLVQGHTFEFYVENDFFTRKEQFILRRAFVDFLKKFSIPHLLFFDVYQQNIMFDEQRNAWEMIDGTVTEIVKEKEKKYDNGAPRKRHSASSCKCCRESADPAHFVSSLGQIAVMQ